MTHVLHDCPLLVGLISIPRNVGVLQINYKHQNYNTFWWKCHLTLDDFTLLLFSNLYNKICLNNSNNIMHVNYTTRFIYIIFIAYILQDIARHLSAKEHSSSFVSLMNKVYLLFCDRYNVHMTLNPRNDFSAAYPLIFSKSGLFKFYKRVHAYMAKHARIA